MRVFQCDGCGVVIKDPYEMNMKEFYVRPDFEFGYMLPHAEKRKVTVHLCKDCYEGVHLIGRKYLNNLEEMKEKTAKDILQNLYWHPSEYLAEELVRLAKKYKINLEE